MFAVYILELLDKVSWPLVALVAVHYTQSLVQLRRLDAARVAALEAAVSRLSDYALTHEKAIYTAHDVRSSIETLQDDMQKMKSALMNN